MNKQCYETPQTQVFDVEIQNVICGSERGTTERYIVGASYGNDDFEE
ncbi:MAG: hypothetical protein IKN88_02610 [Bacteroidales bacterium]|nr:hypothetical protein [Bacteroidales bacterium]